MTSKKVEESDYGNHKSIRWPWVVALVLDTGREHIPICNGVLIDQNIVLTAAHCVVNTTYTYIEIEKEGIKTKARQIDHANPPGYLSNHFKVLAGFGAFDLTRQDLLPQQPYEIQEGTQISGISAVIVHEAFPNFPYGGTDDSLFARYSYSSDLAIIKLKTKIVWDDEGIKRPICLNGEQQHQSRVAMRRRRNTAQEITAPNYYVMDACTGFVVTGFGPRSVDMCRNISEAEYAILYKNVEMNEWMGTRLPISRIQKRYMSKFGHESQIYDKVERYIEFIGPIDMEKHCKEVLEGGSIFTHPNLQGIVQRCKLDRKDAVPRICTGRGWSGSPVIMVKDETWYLYGIVSGSLSDAHSDIDPVIMRYIYTTMAG